MCGRLVRKMTRITLAGGEQLWSSAGVRHSFDKQTNSQPSELHAWLSDAQQPPARLRMAAQQPPDAGAAGEPQWTPADREFMRLALAEVRLRAVLQRTLLTRATAAQAKHALDRWEVPVGCGAAA